VQGERRNRGCQQRPGELSGQADTRSSPLADLAVFYEHPQWFEALFATLTRRGLDWTAVPIQDHTFDPAGTAVPAPVILNRLAMSSFLRQEEHALFYSMAALAHWPSLGSRVINRPRAPA